MNFEKYGGYKKVKESIEIFIAQDKGKWEDIKIGRKYITAKWNGSVCKWELVNFYFNII